MKFTAPLCKQNIARMFKFHWYRQGRRVIKETGAEARLKEMNIPVYDAAQFLRDSYHRVHIEPFQVRGPCDFPKPLDETHPDYKEKVCHVLSDNEVLVEGLQQAQVLTKTIIVEDKLPEAIESLVQKVPEHIHDQIQHAIRTANLFDCEQVKLPKIKDPERPAFNFPRVLGISDVRRNLIMSNTLLDILERNSHELSNDRHANHDVNFVSSFVKSSDYIQLQSLSNLLLSSKTALKPIHEAGTTCEDELPDLQPLKETISITKKNFYNLDSVYPLQPTTKAFHPHTTYLSYNSTLVKNLYETDVTTKQVRSRALIHSFTVASAYAKEKYGDVEDLPEPVTVQCVHTDGRLYSFGVYQLNTLDLDKTDGIKNVWYSTSEMPLFKTCTYDVGIPILALYNPKVYEYLNAFYNNQ